MKSKRSSLNGRITIPFDFKPIWSYIAFSSISKIDLCLINHTSFPHVTHIYTINFCGLRTVFLSKIVRNKKYFLNFVI